jgi:hypothetical protein
MLQLKIPKSRMMKYSRVSSLIGSYIPLTLYCLKKLLTETSVKLELARNNYLLAYADQNGKHRYLHSQELAW